MSENLDLVRSIYADWERGDYVSAGWAHPDIEWVRADGPEPGSWAGVAEMIDQWRVFLATWEEWQTSPPAEYRELDDGRVLVLDHPGGRGKTSGIEMERDGATIFRVRAGKVAEIVSYWSREQALADLGLEA
jgi:ketosteroid isomerase-like protein